MCTNTKVTTYPDDKEIAVCDCGQQPAKNIEAVVEVELSGKRLLWGHRGSIVSMSTGPPVTGSQLSVRQPAHRLYQPAHCSALLIVGYESENAQVHDVDQEVDEKHVTGKPLPLFLQHLAQRVRLEHRVAVLGGERRRRRETCAFSTDQHRAALSGVTEPGLTGMSLP